jgi:hypothetical protein
MMKAGGFPTGMPRMSGWGRKKLLPAGIQYNKGSGMCWKDMK